MHSYRAFIVGKSDRFMQILRWKFYVYQASNLNNALTPRPTLIGSPEEKSEFLRLANLNCRKNSCTSEAALLLSETCYLRTHPSRYLHSTFINDRCVLCALFLPNGS